MKFIFKTLNKIGESQVKEKGSKFFGLAIPVDSEDGIKSELLKLKKNHSQATHICYAYKLGLNEVKFRANDDGEPSNSAGAPILGQLNSFELTNVFIAVIRYYGGTKLGVGGLISAYKNAAKEAIENSQIIEKELISVFELKFSYDLLPDIMKQIKKYQLKIQEQELNENCKIKLAIGNSKKVKVLSSIVEFKGLEFKLLKEEK